MPDESAQPVARALFCPRCGARHVDKGEWATRLHHHHLCAACKHVWREDEYFIGVEALPFDPSKVATSEMQARQRTMHLCLSCSHAVVCVVRKDVDAAGDWLIAISSCAQYQHDPTVEPNLEVIS